MAYLNPAVLNLASRVTGAREAGPAAPPPSGDRRANGVKRVAAAAGEGGMSVPMVHCYLADG